MGNRRSETRKSRREPPPSRVETGSQRALPDFIIIGAQRCGTTSMYNYLIQHPDVGAALLKEVNFFHRSFDKGLDWYRAFFPLRGEARMVGEASPNYLLFPQVPARVRQVLPDVKLIALLRNPIDRAYSEYQLMTRRGHEELAFDRAVEQEIEALEDGQASKGRIARDRTYVRRGLYGRQLEGWLEIFPREQLLVLQSEQFYESPQDSLQKTLDHLGLRPFSPPQFKAFQQRSSYAGMSPETRGRLADYFAGPNQALYTLLGVDFGWA